MSRNEEDSTSGSRRSLARDDALCPPNRSRSISDAAASLQVHEARNGAVLTHPLRLAGGGTLAHRDPANPRFFFDLNGTRRVHVDGQFYMIGYEIDGEEQPNPSNFFSVLVWNTFVPDEPPTWEGSMRSVFTRYGNLYPIMTRSADINLDLADYDQVVARRAEIVAVLQLPTSNTHYMPVSRDLSSSRTAAMIRWLTETGADGLPRRGTVEGPQGALTGEAAVTPAVAAVAARDAGKALERGSKFEAGLRRRATPQATRGTSK